MNAYPYKKILWKIVFKAECMQYQRGWHLPWQRHLFINNRMGGGGLEGVIYFYSSAFGGGEGHIFLHLTELLAKNI